MSNRESRSRSPTPRWQSPARTIAPETSQPGSPQVLKESASTDSIACDIVPKLPSILSLREYKLVKRPPSSSGAGWGVVLRGITSEFVEGTKIYTCHVDSVHEQGAAELCGLKEGDQIVSINGESIKDYEHSDVVKHFQSRSEVSLVILPAKYKSCIFGRINRVNKNVLSYLWSLGRCLHSLEVIEVNLGSDQQPDKLFEIDLTGLVTLQALSFHHCFLNSLQALKGLHTLNRLEYLSFAHNVLTHQVLKRDCAIASLQSLKKLDLSRNLLSLFPECLFELTNLEVLVLAENNITELPSSLAKLTKLNTLCIDGNLLREVDKSILLLPWIQKLTMSNNLLETESLAVKHRQFLITSVQGNPYTSPDQSGMVTRKEPSLRRTVSVRGILHLTNKQKQRLSVEIDSQSEEYCGTSADTDEIYIATQ